MVNKMLALKIYDIDYSFILKNYLDESLWEKEWTIFIFKRFKVTLRLESINVKSKAIWFEVIIDDNSEENKSCFKRFTDTFKYLLSVNDINILKKVLNSTIFSLIRKLEFEDYICYTEKYDEFSEMEETENSKLRKIAEEFLDNENVFNEEIRDAYIDYYIDKNEKVYDLRNNYIEEMKYKILTDFYVAFLEATKDKERLELIEQKVGQEKLDDILKEIEQYKEYMDSEQFESDMQENLEGV